MSCSIRYEPSWSPIPGNGPGAAIEPRWARLRPPPFLTTDWILGQFGQRVGLAQEKYRTFVAEGWGGPRPWDQLTGQIYLGSEDFVAQHQPNRVIRDIPRRQTQAQRPPLRLLFQRRGSLSQRIHIAYRQYGYRLAEIAEHLGVHAATVSRRLK